MITLKDFLSALTNTLMKKSVANVSPGGLNSSVQITQTGQSVTSPCDGYAIASVGQAQSAGAYINIVSGEVSHQHAAGQAGYYAHAHIPVKKGNPISVNYDNFSDTPTLTFISRVGGWAKSLLAQAVRCVRGGVLWLTSSILFARSLGSHIHSLFRSQIVAQSIFKSLPLLTIYLQRRVLGMFAHTMSVLWTRERLSLVTLHPPKAKAQLPLRAFVAPPMEAGLGHGFACEKAIKFPFGSTTTLGQGTRGLSQTREHNLIEAEVCHA